MKEYFLWLAKFITVILVLFVLAPLLLALTVAGTQSALQDRRPSELNRVAVIEVSGVINSARDVVNQLYAQARDPKIKGIVLRVNSPGGAVGPSQEIYSAVADITKNMKPVIASFDAVAASGGLYVALNAARIFTQPSTLTGSIGVVIQIPNFRHLAEWAGVSMITIKSGELKDVGNTFRDMTETERHFLNQTVLKVHEDFIEAIKTSRNLAHEDVLLFADGRILLGKEAKKLGLVDEFGGTLDAARAVFDLLGEPLAEDQVPSLYYPKDRFGPLARFLQTSGDVDSLIGRFVSPRLEFLYLMQ
jgi:protease-4